MKFTLESARDANIVKSHRPGEVRVGERAFTGSLILSATQIVEDWSPASAVDLDRDDLGPALDLDPELIVLGTGASLQFPPVRLRAWVAARGVGLEIMDTGAACRTYNVLMLEGRAVVAALIQ